MMTLSPSSESTTHLGHYGLIAGVFDELGISELIDNLLPKKSGHNIFHSTAIRAMCINGLGFTERRLYLFPAFFKTYPLKGYWEKVFYQNTLMMTFLAEARIKFRNTERPSSSTI